MRFSTIVSAVWLSIAASCSISAKSASSTLYEQLHVTRYPPRTSSRIARRLISL